jgi:hypothetical protein
MPSSSDVIEISDSDDESRPLPPTSSQLSHKSVNSEPFYVFSSDDELPAPGDPAFFQGLSEKAAGKRKRHSSPAASCRSSSVDYRYGMDSSEDDEFPKKIARKASGVAAL